MKCDVRGCLRWCFNIDSLGASQRKKDLANAQVLMPNVDVGCCAASEISLAPSFLFAIEFRGSFHGAFFSFAQFCIRNLKNRIENPQGFKRVNSTNARINTRESVRTKWKMDYALGV